MKLLRHLTMALGLAACFTMSAQSDLKPEVIFPKPGTDIVLLGLSDNGNFAVSSDRTESDDDGASEYSGASLYDLTVSPPKITKLSGSVGTSARDVTDDGKLIVGSSADKPAYWKDGKWTLLPMPAGFVGGHANSVTPDGHYAVGMIKKDNDGMIAEGCMWDLTTNQIVNVPNMPKLDLSGFDQNQNWFTSISADGRYIFGTVSFSYPDVTNLYVYDRNNDEAIYVGHTLEGKTFSPRVSGFETWETDVIGKCMSTNGRYVSGTVDEVTTGDDVAFIFDVLERELKITDGKNETNSWAWNVTNDGIGLCTRPALEPFGECYIYYDNFYYPFKDLMEQVYSLNLNRLNIDNTGKPVLVSADGRTLVFITSPYASHVVKLKEDLKDICEKLDLLKKYEAVPSSGSTMGGISSVKIAFPYPVTVASNAATQIKLLKSDGSLEASPLANGGVVAENNVVSINFRSRVFNEGETYTLNIPAGVFAVDGKPSSTNSEINLKYTGRSQDPVKVVSVSPKDGSELSVLDANESPIILTFDTDIQLNQASDNLIGHLYIDEEETPVSPLTIAPGSSSKTLLVYPPFAQNLYKNSTYRVEIPAGVATDISGRGASEAFSVTYVGTYVPQIGNEQYLFYSDCNDYTNFMFYEGDHGTPTQEYQDMGFTADETPWVVVRESEESTDMAFGSHSCYVDGRQSNDWVATRQIFIPEESNASLIFDSQSYRRSKNDILKVYIYAFDGTINVLNEEITKKIVAEGDLVINEKQSPGQTEANLAGEWTRNIVPLDKYEGKNIYICFVNDNKDQSMIIIDNIMVVRKVSAVIDLETPSNVVSKDSEIIKGRIAVADEAAKYNGLTMILKNAAGKEISKLTFNQPLEYGDVIQFEFPQALPLEIGVANPFTIEYVLDDVTETYEGVINDLSFQTEKRVVIEEFTGRDCQFCPGGIATMDLLEKQFGHQLIPIALHCYNMSDPKGANVIGYWQYTQMNAAPSGIVNRGMITAPLYFSERLGHYVNSNVDLASTGEVAYLWKDEVIAELAEPAVMDVSLALNPSNGSSLSFTATVKSAVNLENQNIRVFGVLLEDNLLDYQRNAYYLTDDPLLGEWGVGGRYANSTAMPVTFNNVARSTWGTSYNGTAGLIPSTIVASQEYTIPIEVPVPSIVDKVANCKFVVMLINESTGKVINACVSSASNGVEGIADDLTGASVPTISASFGAIEVSSASQAAVNVYSTDGTLIGSGYGVGNFSINLNGYRGVAIVKAQNANGAASAKVMVK